MIVIVFVFGTGIFFRLLEMVCYIAILFNHVTVHNKNIAADVLQPGVNFSNIYNQIFNQKCFAKLLCAYHLCLVYFVKSKLMQNLPLKCW